MDELTQEQCEALMRIIEQRIKFRDKNLARTFGIPHDRMRNIIFILQRKMATGKGKSDDRRNENLCAG